jgi:hypothetical protein
MKCLLVAGHFVFRLQLQEVIQTRSLSGNGTWVELSLPIHNLQWTYGQRAKERNDKGPDVYA